MELEDIRREIDGIDDELHRLFRMRMQCSEKVAETKQKTGDAVYKPEREKQVLGRYSGEELYCRYAGKVMQLSRYAQYGHILSADMQSRDSRADHVRIQDAQTQEVQAQDTEFYRAYESFVSAAQDKKTSLCAEIETDPLSERGLSVQEICSLIGDFGTALANMRVEQDKVKLSFRYPDNPEEQEMTKRLLYMLYKESLRCTFSVEQS